MAICPDGVLHFIRECWVCPRPHNSSGQVASFGAELAQPGPSRLTAAQRLSSLTEILVLKGTNKSQGRGTDVASGMLGRGRGLLESHSHGQGVWGRGEGKLRASEMTRAGKRSPGRQTHVPALRAAQGSPWALQSITAQKGVRNPLGLARGRPASQWRCFPRRGLSTHCPAAWIQSLRITNAANNSQQAPGPQACAPRPNHAACARTTHRFWIAEPPHYSLPPIGTRGHPGRKAPTEGIQAPQGVTESHASRARAEQAFSTDTGSPFYS